MLFYTLLERCHACLPAGSGHAGQEVPGAGTLSRLHPPGQSPPRCSTGAALHCTALQAASQAPSSTWGRVCLAAGQSSTGLQGAWTKGGLKHMLILHLVVPFALLQSAARVAATVLTRAAVDRGSRDNVTVRTGLQRLCTAMQRLGLVEMGAGCQGAWCLLSAERSCRMPQAARAAMDCIATHSATLCSDGPAGGDCGPLPHDPRGDGGGGAAHRGEGRAVAASEAATRLVVLLRWRLNRPACRLGRTLGGCSSCM